jgi:hypothetical protein
MEATLEIYMPLPMEVFGAFLGILVLAMLYYVAKFIITAVLGG